MKKFVKKGGGWHFFKQILGNLQISIARRDENTQLDGILEKIKFCILNTASTTFSIKRKIVLFHYSPFLSNSFFFVYVWCVLLMFRVPRTDFMSHKICKCVFIYGLCWCRFDAFGIIFLGDLFSFFDYIPWKFTRKIPFFIAHLISCKKGTLKLVDVAFLFLKLNKCCFNECFLCFLCQPNHTRDKTKISFKIIVKKNL